MGKKAWRAIAPDGLIEKRVIVPGKARLAVEGSAITVKLQPVDSEGTTLGPTSSVTVDLSNPAYARNEAWSEALELTVFSMGMGEMARIRFHGDFVRQHPVPSLAEMEAWNTHLVHQTEQDAEADAQAQFLLDSARKAHEQSYSCLHVHLVSLSLPKVKDRLLSIDHRRQKAHCLTMAANIYRSKKQTQRAFRKFKTGLVLFRFKTENDIIEEWTDEDEFAQEKLPLLNGAAACMLTFGSWDVVLPLCAEVLVLDRDNQQALARRGIALAHLQRYDDSLADLLLHDKLQKSSSLPQTGIAKLAAKYLPIVTKRQHRRQRQHDDLFRGVLTQTEQRVENGDKARRDRAREQRGKPDDGADYDDPGAHNADHDDKQEKGQDNPQGTKDEEAAEAAGEGDTGAREADAEEEGKQQQQQQQKQRHQQQQPPTNAYNHPRTSSTTTIQPPSDQLGITRELLPATNQLESNQVPEVDTDRISTPTAIAFEDEEESDISSPPSSPSESQPWFDSSGSSDEE